MLHPTLARDSLFVCSLMLSQVRLMNDANYPWFILVPQQTDISEPHQLNLAQQQLLTKESRILSLSIENCFAPDKINIASIGNMVAQLHLHHIARYTSDMAWPKPVWGLFEAGIYDKQLLHHRMQLINDEIAKQQNLISEFD